MKKMKYKSITAWRSMAMGIDTLVKVELVWDVAV